MISRRALGGVLAGGAAPAATRAAVAQDRAYPERPIRMVVGFPAGQSLDVGARVIANKLTEVVGQPVVVDNRPGASGILSHEFVKGAAPDGYTLLMGSTASLGVNPALYRKLPYDPLKDFAPVALINSSPMFLATNTQVPVRDLREMVAYARARPGGVSYGSSGSGTTQHIAMEMLKRETGLDLLHVPYRGAPAMVTDLIAGRVQFAFDTSTSILPHAEGGRVRLVAVSSRERSPRAPEVPTVAETGLPGFLALTWAALVGPAGMPTEVVERLNAAANRVLGLPEVIAHYASTGGTIAGGTPADLGRFLREEVARWGEAVAASGAQVD